MNKNIIKIPRFSSQSKIFELESKVILFSFALFKYIYIYIYIYFQFSVVHASRKIVYTKMYRT